jgi:hypothetical protein
MKIHKGIDITELRQLWEDGWQVHDLAERFGCTATYIYWLRKKYSFSDRERSQSKEPEPPSPEDATASCDSLTLSPWVAARAEEFRRQKEAKGEAVYSGVYLRTYSLRTMREVTN